MELLPQMQSGRVQPFQQDESQVSFSHKFKKEDGKIDWQKSPQEIDRQVRAFCGWPGTFTTIGDKRMIIHQAHLDSGQLVLDVVQIEGKNPVFWTDFWRGYKGPKPDWLKKVKF